MSRASSPSLEEWLLETADNFGSSIDFAAGVASVMAHLPDGRVVVLQPPIANRRQATFNLTELLGLPAESGISAVTTALTEAARTIAVIADRCSVCNKMQSNYIAVHECVNVMRDRRQLLPVSRDASVSRSELDGTPSRASRLPLRVWSMIAEYLPTEALLWLPAIEKGLLAANRDDLVWGTLYERHFELPLVRLPSWRQQFLQTARLATAERYVPSLGRFLRDCCPTGTVAIGREKFQIVDYYPAMIGVQQRGSRNMRTRLEAATVPLPGRLGAVTLVALCAVDPALPSDATHTMRHVRPFLNAHLLSALKTLLAEGRCAPRSLDAHQENSAAASPSSSETSF